MTTTRLTALLIVTIIVALLIVLPGCAGFMQPGPDRSAAQIKEIVRDKSGSVVCISAIGPYGTYTLKTITLDQNVIKNGGLTVSDDCKTVEINTESPPRPVATPAVKPASP